MNKFSKLNKNGSTCQNVCSMVKVFLRGMVIAINFHIWKIRKFSTKKPNDDLSSSRKTDWDLTQLKK